LSENAPRIARLHTTLAPAPTTISTTTPEIQTGSTSTPAAHTLRAIPDVFDGV
jgi:hypothetical protein